ncbi:tetratricopeptide repeat protein [Sphingobacterium sp. SRCM116780]|uniref:tetratricopeptide repeat protein n=1 Tax=Sphingobacterium sp. SRCM116780 TaxID=2907623 RepID=UPI001F266AA8|nr:tetratricopeptide repeat protein [Sphingobacterium sp. SRCM116780]UIR57320.1 tetratricopeptide repeat protein [Sphingobacterium sp. SRCM116780]
MLVFLFLIMIGYVLKFGFNSIHYSVIIYLLLLIVLKTAVPLSHKKGMSLIKKGEFRKAIEKFENSVTFFTKNAWVDKFRYITILSSSKMCYREMALCNIAFCYTQTNEPTKARYYYEMVLREYPNNGLAIAALNAIKTFSKE